MFKTIFINYQYSAYDVYNKQCHAYQTIKKKSKQITFHYYEISDPHPAWPAISFKSLEILKIFW